MFVSKPSPTLQAALVRSGLCNDRDFRRCRRYVRRLSRGLPPFDFVWVDALVQLGRLTPFQARTLATSSADTLRVGSCVLLERLGTSQSSETYRGRVSGCVEQVVLKRLRLPADAQHDCASKLRGDAGRLSGLLSPFVAYPRSVEEQEHLIILLSRHVAGPTCGELLIRRGRFPVEVVWEIARQLAEGLAALESRGCLHGDLRLKNVRLTASGQAVLVDAAIRPSLDGGLLIRDDVSPDLYDGTAPELIGTGNPLTTSSEMYAFGSLLWQLLAGRAPFPTGDPLAKLAAHQSRDIPDVRGLVPDTPAPLAEAVRAFTHRDAARRPRTFADVTARFGRAEKLGERRLARFRQQFQTAAPPQLVAGEKVTHIPRGAAATVLLALALCGAAIGAVEFWPWSAARSLVSVASTSISENDGDPIVPSRPGHKEHPPRHPETGGASSRRLPSPNADGLLLLGEGPYDARTVTCVGDLAIRGTAKAATAIVVKDRSLKLACRKLVLEHITLQSDSSRPSPIVEVCSQELSIDRCTFESADAPDPVHEDAPAIVWTSAAARDPDAGRIRLANSVFFNAGPAIVLASDPDRLEALNCLKVGGALFELKQWPASSDISILARRLTLRQADSLCHARVAARRGARLHIIVQESIFDLAVKRSALVRLESATRLSRQDAEVIVNGRDSVIRPNIAIVGWSQTGASQSAAIVPVASIVEGLAVGDFRFVGPASKLPDDAAIDPRSLQIPRDSDEPPGIVAAELPRPNGTKPRRPREVTPLRMNAN